MSRTSRRSSLFSPLSTRPASSGGSVFGSEKGKNDFEISRITRKQHVKIQTTSHGCFCTLFLLVGVPDTDQQTPFPLLADRHVELREWNIHTLDAHWAAPALSESAARAAAVFKIPVSTDLALDESDTTASTAVILSTGGNLNLIVPAGAAPVHDSAKHSHTESGRGYLVTLVMELQHLRTAPGWPLQVTIPVPRCLMNTFEFRISSSDQVSAKETPVRIYPKLIGMGNSPSEEALETSSAPVPGNEPEVLSTKRCTITTGPKIKGMFTATSNLNLAWLSSTDLASSYDPKHPVLRPLQAAEAQIDTLWTGLDVVTQTSSTLVCFEATCALAGLLHTGIDERAYVKLELESSTKGVVLSEAQLASSSASRSLGAKGVVGLRQGFHQTHTRKVSRTSRIPSMRHSEPHTAPPTQASGPSKGFDFTLMDTTSLDENGDLMKVAPPKGLFSHDLSFSVDHQAFVDESAIADMSNLDRLKQFAHGTGPGAQGAAASHGDRKNEDLPPSVLSNGNSLAIIVDVDEALGILPNRLKDAITIRISGKVMVPDVDLQSLQNTRLTVLTASECQETSTLSGGVEFQLADAARRAEEERQVRQDAELAKAREEAGRAEEERHGRQDGELAKTKAEAARVMAAQQERDTVQHDVQSVLPGSSRQQIPRNHSSDSSIVQKHTRISPSTPPVDIDNVDTPVRNPPVLLRHASAEEDAGDETVLQQDLDGLSPTATPKPAPVAMPAKDISTNSPRADGVSTSGLSSPLHAPLAPKLARAIRKHSLSRGSLGTPPPASPSVTAGSQVGSEGSGQSLGSGQKRADWLAANQASVVGLGLKGNGQGGAAGAEPLADWTMQDISTSMVGDQSLSHAALPYTVHEAKVELVPTLRNSGGKEGEEVRMVRKLICPAWPRADLEGRIVPVPNVTLIMADTDEILSVWCDHARLKWEKVEPKSDEAVELDPGVVRIRVELPASLRNARSSTDSWKLEVRVASPWSSDHATTLRAGGSVEVDIPLLDCAIGTLELHVCKPSDAWPRPVVESDGFRTQRPTDVKAYFTQDDVQSSRPLKAKISYVRDSILKAQKQSGAKISAVTILLAVVVLLLAVGIVNSANLRPSSTQRKSSYPTHLGTLARHSTLQTQTSGIMAAPSSSYGYVASQPREDGGDDSKVQDRHSDTMQNVFKTETSDIPAAKVDDRFGNIDQSVASDAGDEQNIDDADDAVADGKNYLHALDGTGQTLWQRMLDSFFGLFRRMWTP